MVLKLVNFRMYFVTSLLLLISFMAGIFCSDVTVGDLSPDTAAELKYILENSTKDIKANCRGHQVANWAEFYLYNREYYEKPVVLENSTLTYIDPNKDVIILIHGWLSNSTQDILKLKDAYLKPKDCNIITVDWSAQAFLPYTKAFCDVPGIARDVSQFLFSISKTLSIPLNNIHIIGHSLGAHIAGLASHLVSHHKKKIGRITGLDPAGPIYQKLKENERLDKSDAAIVIIIHTDKYGTGISTKWGTEDLYPYGGGKQPTCPLIKNINNDTLLSDGKSLHFCTLLHHEGLVMQELANPEDMAANFRPS